MIVFGNPHVSSPRGTGTKASKWMVLTADENYEHSKLKFMLRPVEVVYF